MAKAPIWVSKGQAAQVGPNIRPDVGIEGAGRLGAPIMKLADQMQAANSGMQISKEGRGSFDMHPDTMKPKSAPRRMSSPMQKLSQHKAAAASAAKKKIIAAAKPKPFG
jgi:hypothetical protein